MIERFVFASPLPSSNDQDFFMSWANSYCGPIRSLDEVQAVKLYPGDERVVDSELSPWRGCARLSFQTQEEVQAFVSNPEYHSRIRNEEARWAAIWTFFQIDTERKLCVERANASQPTASLVALTKRDWSRSLAEYTQWVSEEFFSSCGLGASVAEYEYFAVLDEEYAVGEPKFDGIHLFSFRSNQALEDAMSGDDGIFSRLRKSPYVSNKGLCVLPVRDASSEANNGSGSSPAEPDSLTWSARPRTGAMAITEQLRAAGLIGCSSQVLIGNPGSGEELLYLELGDEIHLGLSEASVGHILDGASRLNQKPAVAVAHGYVGFSGLQGAVFNAAQRQSPMLVIVGTADSHAHTSESHMYADVEGAAKSTRAKYVKNASDPESLLRDLRDAIVQAKTQPYGPVVFIVGSNVASMPNEEEVIVPSLPDTRLSPPEDELERLALEILDAKHPAMLIGDGVANSCAVEELRVFSELVGADVWASMESQVNFPRHHALFKGNLGHMDDRRGREILKDVDVAVAIGTPVYQTVFNSRLPLFSQGAVVATVNLDPESILRGHNDIDIPLIGDPKTVLSKLTKIAECRLGSSGTRQAAENLKKMQAERDHELRERQSENLRTPGVSMAKVGNELEKQMLKLPDRPIIFNEALVGAIGLTDHIQNVNVPGTYFDTSGGSLGEWAGAIGSAMTGKKTIGIIGDGGFHYAPQALWNAAAKKLPLGLIVANNSSYGLLYDNMRAALRNLGIRPSSAPKRHFYEINGVDYVSIANGYGVPGLRVAHESEIAVAVSRMLRMDGPFLIDLVMEQYDS